MLGHAARAQTLRGRVFAADGRTSVPGVALIAIASNGDTSARTFSGVGGAYEFVLSTPGQYRLRILRVGQRPQLSDLIVVAQGVTLHDVVLIDSPIQLDTVRALDVADCRVPRGEGTTLAQLWEQARTALLTATLPEGRGGLRIHALVLSGAERPDGTMRSIDSLSVREVLVSRIFTTRPPDTLARYGYIRRDTTGRVVYEVPTAETLLSDSFIETHCFKLDTSSDTLFGLSFVPRAQRESVSDVQGTLWLKRGTGEPRSVEFTYTNISEFSPMLCGHISVAREGCRSNDLTGAGGAAEFRRLATGEWLTTAWFVKTLPESLTWRPLKDRQHQVNRVWETCYRGHDCQQVLAAPVLLETVTGRVIDVERKGDRLYVDSVAARRLAKLIRLAAGPRPAGLRGIVTEETGQPVSGAVVQTLSPVRVAVTQTDGSFEMPFLPPKTIQLRVRCLAYRGATFTLPLLSDSTRSVRIGLVPIGADTVIAGGSRACQPN
jgi:hypothetical protein